MDVADRTRIHAMAWCRQAGAMTERDGRNAGDGTAWTVTGRGRSLRFALASLGLFSLGCPALAADLPVKAPVPYLASTQAFDWTGWYIAGLRGGYNYVFPSRLMLGFEADASFPNSDVVVPFSVKGSQTIVSPFAGTVTYARQWSMTAASVPASATPSSACCFMGPEGSPTALTR